MTKTALARFTITIAAKVDSKIAEASTQDKKPHRQKQIYHPNLLASKTEFKNYN